MRTAQIPRETFVALAGAWLGSKTTLSVPAVALASTLGFLAITGSALAAWFLLGQGGEA